MSLNSSPVELTQTGGHPDTWGRNLRKGVHDAAIRAGVRTGAKPMTPAFAAPYSAWLAAPLNALIEAMLTTRCRRSPALLCASGGSVLDRPEQ